MGNINDYLILVDGNDRYLNNDELKDKDIEDIILNNNINYNEKILKDYEEIEKKNFNNNIYLLIIHNKEII